MSENLIGFTKESLSEIYRQQGYEVVKSESCYWYNEYHQKYIYIQFPFHLQISPTKEEIQSIFRQIPSAIGLRFISPVFESGKLSCIWNCRKPYDLSTLEKKARNQTRRGLERCSVRKISFSQLTKLAGEANADTLKRHGDKANGLGFDSSLDKIPAYQAWAAFIDEVLAAFIIVLLVEDYAHIIVERSVNSLLKYYPNNALVYQVVSELLSFDNIHVVSYGWDSLISNLGLERFKLGMGFIKEPVKQRIVINPRFRIIINKPICNLIVKIIPRSHMSNRFQKMIALCEIITSS